MSVIRIVEKPSFRVEIAANGSNRRQRFFLIACGVNTDDDVCSTAETDAGRITAPAEVSETSAGRSDRWAVVLFDDDHHSMDYVIWALLKTVPDLSSTDAALIMLEAHNTGKGVVTLCGREQAMVYRDGLRVRQLGCDIEPGW